MDDRNDDRCGQHGLHQHHRTGRIEQAEIAERSGTLPSLRRWVTQFLIFLRKSRGNNVAPARHPRLRPSAEYAD
jgi:hypothetical protein